MTSPTKAGEQSMEEILASIRKIIAEDPSKAATLPDVTAAMQQPAATGSTTPAVRPGAPFGRLSDALNATFATAPPLEAKAEPDASGAQSKPPRLDASPPRDRASFAGLGKTSTPPASERAQSIDSELEDILNEPFSGASSTPAPVRSFEPETPAGGAPPQSDAQWAVWRTASSGPGSLGSVAGKESSLGGPTPSSGLPRFNEPSPGTDAASAGGRSRPAGGGFYPASGSFGAAPAAFEPREDARPNRSPRFEPKLPQSEPEKDAAAGFGSVVPKRDGTFPDRVEPSVSKPLSGFGDIPLYEPPLPREDVKAVAENGVAAKPGPVVIASMPGPNPAAFAPPATGSTSETASAASPSSDASARAMPTDNAAVNTAQAPGAPGISVPLPPRTALFTRPFMPEKMDAAKAPATLPPVRPAEAAVPVARPPMQTPVPPRTPAPQAPVAPAAPAQVPAAVSALDALAAGLAASNVSATVAPPGVPAAETGASGQPVRTLEDAIAEMIKPMLQKWISDNMPRIIEKALRVEVGQPGKDGSKPPGT